ncbi:hypothetical protein EYR40_006716 [Pleurotus pulmonarius]|nr:hypothetical protein EYR40_006716 [Pleurotus pulmonarius]
MPNQYKPLPPTEQIEEYLQFYYNLRLTDGEIAKHMEKHYNTELYGLGVYSVKKLRKQLGLLSTRQQKHTLESIRQQVLEIREQFPQHGIENIRKSLHTDYGLFVPRTLVAEFLHLEEPEAVKQHPRVVCQWYLEAVRKLGAIPLVTQSDPGTENFGVANAHTIMRHHMDPSLSETMQHQWMQDKQNIKAEIIWSLLRRDWTPGFENILDEGVNNGWYKAADPLEKYVTSP